MPTSAPRMCGSCGTPVHGRCPDCYESGWTARPSTAWAGGSTRRWRRVREQKLQADPMCEYTHVHDAGEQRSFDQAYRSPCSSVQCGEHVAACQRLATEVDHMRPLAQGGPKWEQANLQSLCHDHHVLKTTREARRGSQTHCQAVPITTAPSADLTHASPGLGKQPAGTSRRRHGGG